MIILHAFRFFRAVFIEARALQREMAKRYPQVRGF